MLDLYVNKKLFEIREQTGLFYSCHAILESRSFLTANHACIRLLVSAEHLEQTKQTIKTILQDLVTNGIDEQTLTIAKHNYLLELATLLDSTKAQAASYTYLLAHDKKWDHFDKQTKKIKTMDLATINNVAKKYFDPTTWTFVQAGRLAQPS